MLTLKSKIYCVIALFVASFAATSVLLLRELSLQASQDYSFTTLQLSTQNSARVVQLNFKKQVQAWKDILLRGSDPASFQKYQDEFLKEEAEVRGGAQALFGQLSDAEIRTETQRFIDSHRKLSEDYKNALHVFRQSGRRNFHAADSLVKGKDRPVTDALDRIVAGLNARTQHHQEENRERFEAKLVSMSAGMLAAVTALLVTGVYIARTINRSTRELLSFLNTQVSELSAGRADLTRRFASVSHDEFGKIADAFNAYTQALEKIVSKLSLGIQQIASASEEISSGASQSAANASQQADQANRVAAVMGEMSNAVQEVAANSQQAFDSALKAAAAARQGGEVVKQTVTTMTGIAGASNSVAERITSLGHASGEIGKIVAVIGDIADQTNLLALNAAIEAARAGEGGRGFAVVADEVRKLAERTTTATKEIANVVQSIQDGTSGSVEAIEQSGHQIQAGMKKATASGTALEEIIHLAANVGDLVSHIATAATQQSAATAQVNSSVSKISDLTQNSSGAAQETAKACADLSQLALELDNLIRGFKHSDKATQSSRHAPLHGTSIKPRAKGAAAASTP